MFDGRRFLHGRDDVARCHPLADRHLQFEIPIPFRQRRHVHAAAQEGPPVCAAVVLGQGSERALHPVEHLSEETRAQPHVERTTGVDDGASDLEPSGRFVDLDHRRIAAQPDDLSDQAPATDTNHVVEARSVEPRGDDDRPGHPLHLAHR